MQATRPSFEEPYLKLSSAWSFSKAFQSKSNVPCAKSITKERRVRAWFSQSRGYHWTSTIIWCRMIIANFSSCVCYWSVSHIDQRPLHIKRQKIQGKNYYWLLLVTLYISQWDTHMNWTLWLVNYWHGLTFSPFFSNKKLKNWSNNSLWLLHLKVSNMCIMCLLTLLKFCPINGI